MTYSQNIPDSDIYHHTKVATTVAEHALELQQELDNELQVRVLGYTHAY